MTSEPEKLLDLIGRVEWDMTNRSQGDGSFLTHEVEVATLLIALRARLSSPVSGTDMVMVLHEPTESMIAAGKAELVIYADCGASERDADKAAKWVWRAMLNAALASPTPPIPVIAEAGEREPLLAREIAAQFYDKRDPLDQSYRDVAHNIRRGRLDDQDVVELVRFALAHAALSTPATLDNTAVEVETLRKIVQVVADADSEDTVGSLDIDIPNGGYPRQWLRDAACAALTAKTEKAK